MPKQTDDNIQESLNRVADALARLDDEIHAVDKNLAEVKVSFEHHTAQDENMYAELKRMNDILADNTESLKVHMKRTELLEQAVMNMETRLNPLELERIKKQAVNKWLVDTAVIIGKILGGVAALIGAWLAIHPN